MTKRSAGPSLRTIAIPGSLAMLLAGCAMTPDKMPPPLQEAQAAYQQAEQNADVIRYAEGPLDRAAATLNRAETAWKEEGDEAKVEHLAYLTQRRVEIARAIADRKHAEATIQDLSEEREQLKSKAQRLEAQQARAEAERAKQRARRLQDELAAVQAKAEETERGLVLTLGDVLFAFDKANLKSGARRNLEPLVTFLRENPKRDVLIEGHTDSIGPEAYNQRLSQRRAQAVADFLMRKGIDPGRITTRGYGEAYPVASNETDAGRQQNRRVEVVILRKGEVATDHMR